MNTYILSPMPLKVEGKSLNDLFYLVGGNPGNMVFFDSVKKQVNYKGIYDIDSWDSKKITEEGGGSIIVPSSNFIRHVRNDPFFQNFIDFLERTDNPITFCGLGAQGTPIFNTPKKLVGILNKTQLKFFKMISERAVTLGVRGEFTAECLELMGIHNHRIIGCPSFFKYTDGVYPDVAKPRTENMQMTVTSGDSLKTKVLKMGMKYDCFWVKQSFSEYLRYTKSQKRLSPKWVIRNFPGDLGVLRNIADYDKRKSKIFFDIEEWNSFYRQENVGFAFGTRFHGNMCALRNGVPAVWIVHDTRTRELTKYLHLPSVEIKDFAKMEHIEELTEMCDYSDTRSNYKALLDNYVSYLEENNISNYFNI